MGALYGGAAFGGTPIPGLVLGGDARLAQSGLTLVSSLGAFTDWYPAPRGGWHIGMGVDAVLFNDPVQLYAPAGAQVASGWAPGGALFGGYDWWILRQWSVGLVALLSATPLVVLRDSNNDDTGYHLMPLVLSLSVSGLFH